MSKRLIISTVFTIFLVFTNVQFGQTPEPIIQTGHSNAVTLAAFSPDERILASVGNDGNIKLWDLERSVELRTLPGDTDLIRSIRFSPDGKTLASAGRDGIIKLWDVDSGRVFRTLENAGAVSSLAVSPDGRILAVADENYAVFLWEIESGRLLPKLDCKHLVTTLVFNTSGTILYGGSRTGLTSWNLQTGKIVKTFTEYTGESKSIAINSNGKVLANILFGDTSNIALNNLRERNRAELPGNAQLKKANFIPVARENEEFSVELWDIEKENLICTIPGHEKSILSVVFSPDGKTLATGGSDRIIKLWNVATCNEISSFDYSDSVYAISFSPDGKSIAGGSGDNVIKLWDIESRETVKLLSRPSDIITAALRPDGKILAVAKWDRTITFIDLESEQPSVPIPFKYPAMSIAFSPDGKTLAIKTIYDQKSLLKIDSKEETPVEQLPDWFASAINNHKISIEQGRRRIRLRDPEQKMIGEFLVFQADDWVVLNSEKFFHGSPLGQTRLLWRFTENLFDVAPVDAFYYEYYYPGLLKKVLAGEKPQLPANTRAFEQKDIRQANVFTCRKCPCSPEIQFSVREEAIAQFESNICIDILASPDFAASDFIDFNALAKRLVSGSDPLSREIFSAFLSGNIIDNKKALQDYVQSVNVNPEQNPDRSLVQMMRREFNGFLRQKEFFNKYNGFVKNLSATTRALSLTNPKGVELAWLNRMLLEDAFAGSLKRGKIHNLESAAGQTLPPAEMETDRKGKCPENEMCLQDMRLFWNSRLIQRWRGDIAAAKHCKNAGQHRIQCQTKVPVVTGVKNYYSAYLFNQDRVKSRDGELILK